MLTRPDHLKDHQRERIETARTACHEMTAVADLIHHFAALLDPADDNATLLSTWVTSAQAEAPSYLHAFTQGLEKDRAAADAALTLPHHNSGIEGMNNKTKLTKRQVYGHASFPPPPQPHSPRLITPSITTDYGTNPLTVQPRGTAVPRARPLPCGRSTAAPSCFRSTMAPLCGGSA
ncbi:transposase [Streptomyces somaliensis]|uniref:transposase n=1 Tax=Streptomyces somaliensis TaxID=78355 RepID=UPI0034E93D9E